MTRILFVDDEIKVLDGLRRLLYSFRAEWTMSFASSGCEALSMLSRAPFDVVVTDIRMPQMDGTELLAEVKQRYPSVVRVILSGQADRDLTLRAAAIAHQYLSKPCDAETLKSTIARASAIKDMFSEPSLQLLLAGSNTLPSVPSVYTELVRQVESEDSSIGDVAEVIGRDTALTAKILQLANSSFFGGRRRVSNPKEAVLQLGFETLSALTLSLKVFSQYTASTCRNFSIEALSSHSVLVGSLAKKIAKAIGLSNREIEDSFMAGLLHDVGKLVLVGAAPENYSRAIKMTESGEIPLWAAEHVVFGTTHAEVGTYLLCLWGLPHAIVEAVAYHHAPSQCVASGSGPLAAVHIANALSHSIRGGDDKVTMPGSDTQYLGRLGLSEKIGDWRNLTEESTRERSYE